MPTRRPVWLLRVLLLVLGFSLVLVAELVTRLLGFGGAPPLLVPLDLGAGGSVAQYEINPRLPEPFFSRVGPTGAPMVGGHRRELVTVPKPPGTTRVLVLGASSVEGFPLPRNLTATRFLEQWLQELLPNRPVEVLNLGITAVASFPVRVVGERAIEELEPDLVIVYAGHNELYGAGGVASRQFLGRRVEVMELVYAMRRSGLFQVAQSVVRPPPRDAAEHREHLIEVMGAAPKVEPGGALYAAARRSLNVNLALLIEATQSRGVPIVLATVAANERGLAPIASWDATDPPAPDDDLATEVDQLEDFLEEHPDHATARHRLGRALEGLGRIEEATEAYRQARDDDAMPWRAPRATNTMIRKLALEHGVPLADCELSFAAAVTVGPGWDLFYDHVHPSLRGQALLASTLLEATARAGLFGLDSEDVERRRPWRDVAAELGAHRLEQYLVVHKMQTLFSTPPIGTNNEAAADLLDAMLRRIGTRLDEIERHAVAAWEEGSVEAGFVLPISYFAASVALESGRPERAIEYARAARGNSMPVSDERAAASLLGLLARRLLGPDAGWETDLASARLEAESLLASGRSTTALLARAAAGLALLDGDLDAAARHADLATTLEPRALPWSRPFLDHLPPAELLQRLGSASQRPAEGSPEPAREGR